MLCVWCFLSTPLELLQITCLLTFVSLVFFDVSVFSDQYLLQEFRRYLRSVAHLYVIYRIAICLKDLLQYDYRRKTFWETFSYLVCPLMWWIIFDAAIEIFGK